jgi:hypothetical protein
MALIVNCASPLNVYTHFTMGSKEESIVLSQSGEEFGEAEERLLALFASSKLIFSIYFEYKITKLKFKQDP